MFTGSPSSYRQFSIGQARPLFRLLSFVTVFTGSCIAQSPRSTFASADPSHPLQNQVTYEDGLLTIVANNSSLNQIVREIAQRTGMKVSGRVSEDRVFGTYGPASSSSILTTLLDGSGSNLLIVQNANGIPVELILTPRLAGVSPPNPNGTYSNENVSADAAPPSVPSSPPASNPQSSSNSRAPNRVGTGGIDTNPAATAPSSTSQQVVFPPVDASTPPSTATTTPTSPDPTSTTPKTPQQIFEQLQRLRQQQLQPSTSQPK